MSETRYSRSTRALRAALSNHPGATVRVVTFTEANPAPIWHRGDIVARQTGRVAVADLGGYFVGLLGDRLDAIASFRIPGVAS